MGREKEENNICWFCKKAYGYCSWSAIDPETEKVMFRPVRGWTAKKVSLNYGTYGKEKKRRMTETYYITACPQFVRG